MHRRAVIRSFRSEDEGLLFGLARLDRGADERTLAVLQRETVFVAEVEGSAAGYVALELRGDAVRVDQLFVSSDHEEEDLGPQLLAYAEGYAISQSARVLQVVVEPENHRAVTFYRGRGFVLVGDELLELVLPCL